MAYTLRLSEWSLLLIWIIFWSFWLILAWKTRSPVKRQQPALFSPKFIIIIVIWIFISVIFPEFMFRQFLPDNITIVLFGTLITILGLGFAIWARLHLGMNWSGQPMIKVDHKLIQTGPYKVVRNPIYSGILVGFIGTALVIGKFWVIIAIFVILGVFLIKIRMEEKFLLEEFGEEYARYRREVKSLIPYIV